MSSTDTRSMPHDLHAERVVIGVVMQSGIIPAGARRLEPEDFYLPAHRAIFGAMLRLDAREVAITSAGIYRELQRTGEIVLLQEAPACVQ